ncbi:MAG: hypothetical protein BGO32_02495 [Bacteroidetes bacterium 37-13]|nr:MAG: hypothetical protein BGO32_02495 [Bacteroidetes bacterium 37-13]
MDYKELIKFYEANVEILQILKSLRKRGEDFYKNFKVTELIPELSNSFFEMNKAEICNNLAEFFFQLQKQIEAIIDYTIKELITLDKIKADSKAVEILDVNGNKIKLGASLFNIENDELFESKIDAIDYKKISITTKINIFYAYLISKNPNEKNDKGFVRNSTKFNIYSINTMVAFRNKLSHGNVELTESQKKSIGDAEKKNEDNLYFFYGNYYRLLYEIVSKVNNVKDSKTFLL